jgi:small GTP-binding protein
MKRQIIGVFAHVDAGKTTLSEGLLYLTGTLRQAGRVDKGDTLLDFDPMEQERGITVFSGEAGFTYGGTEFTLVDTPGHRDFSPEMERPLSVIDMAVLVVSGTEGVQSHTGTILKLLDHYRVPTVVFINKMDMNGADKNSVMGELREVMPGAVDFEEDEDALREDLASCSESLMEEFFAGGSVSEDSLREAVQNREVFPVVSGSALKMEGLEKLLDVLDRMAPDRIYPEEFGARVYKITRDIKGNRLTHLKVTGGVLKTKMLIETRLGSEETDALEEKVEQIRIYQGNKFRTVSEAPAGTLAAVLGLNETYAGQALGSHRDQDTASVMEPAVSYSLILPRGEDPMRVLPVLRELEEEDPSLKVGWEESTREIRVSIMGELGKDLLIRRIRDRLDIDVELGQGRIIYKETISAPVEGVGHYEPLRHYAEVRLLLEPLPEGSGLVFASKLSTDVLASNWQNLIMQHLQERQHKGTLTRSAITDMKITLTDGRSHLKHTSGGDFRQATYRAVRQGLRRALDEGKEVLLEPMYDFVITVPRTKIGRVMTDMERLGARCRIEEAGRRIGQSADMVVIAGHGPVATLRDYQSELNSFTEGMGRFEARIAGYGPCHNTEEVVAEKGYDPDLDQWNPCGSVFTEGGAGTYVEWDMVDSLARTESYLKPKPEEDENYTAYSGGGPVSIGGTEKDLKRIFEMTYGVSKRDEQLRKAARAAKTRRPKEDEDQSSAQARPKPTKPVQKKPPYMVVDGYNVIFSWERLKSLAQVNIDSARDALIDSLQNYQGYTGITVVLVFDGYRVKGSPGSREKYEKDLRVIYTGEAQTADRFIEEFIYHNGKKYDISVVTSDRQVQMSALGSGAVRLSSRELEELVRETEEEIRTRI